MNYITRHKADWEELALLTQRASRFRGVTSLSAEEISRLDVLYRKTCSQLAQVSSRTSDPELLRYLNGLVAAAHSILYTSRRTSVWKGALEFVANGFACEIAARWRFHLVSLLLLLCGFAVGYMAVNQDPLAAYALMPGGEFRQPGATPEQLMEIIRGGRDMGSSGKFLFASFLFQHNLKVGILSLTIGILAAIPTICLIVYNGIILGAFTATHHQANIILPYWAWILPHGITELGAIVLCGGAGLQLGYAVLCPGMQTIKESLRKAGRSVVRILIGVLLMLVFAAFIESYLRQSHLSDTSRLVFGCITLLFWATYIFRGRRRNRQNAEYSSASAIQGFADAVRHTG